MNRRLSLALLMSILMLAGCYRQASDSFEQVNSQSVQSIASPTVVDVTSTPTESSNDSDAQNMDATETTPLGDPSKTPDPEDIDPTDIPPITATVGSRPTSSVPIVPTATNPGFVTPEPPPGQVEQPTINPPTATATQSILQPTFTQAPSADDECVYTVVAGDNLFRIAINNGTTVEAIKQLNNLESDAIQVEQLLRIPGCVAGQAETPTQVNTQTIISATATNSSGGSSVATVQPADNLPSGGEQIHVVVSGETLGAIANRYGVSINAIIDLNRLTDPNALSIGQELIIPPRSN